MNHVTQRLCSVQARQEVRYIECNPTIELRSKLFKSFRQFHVLTLDSHRFLLVVAMDKETAAMMNDRVTSEWRDIAWASRIGSSRIRELKVGWAVAPAW